METFRETFASKKHRGSTKKGRLKRVAFKVSLGDNKVFRISIVKADWKAPAVQSSNTLHCLMVATF